MPLQLDDSLQQRAKRTTTKTNHIRCYKRQTSNPIVCKTKRTPNNSNQNAECFTGSLFHWIRLKKREKAATREIERNIDILWQCVLFFKKLDTMDCMNLNRVSETIFFC